MINNLLSDLTIVIFSFNRHYYLTRTINYWSKYNVKILVLDGSDNILDDDCLNVKNLHYIYDNTSLYSRLLQSVNYIKTKYIILSGDDEYYIPSALASCISFLNNNLSYSSCGGCAVGFFSYKDQVYGVEKYGKLRDLDLHQNQASKRISKHFSSYVPAHVYSVLRNSTWKVICKNIFKYEYSFFASMELQIEFLIMVSGKSKIISELMWLRNKDVTSIRGTSPSLSTDVKINDWWGNKKFKKEKNHFLFNMKATCDELLKNNHIEIEDIKRLFEIYIFHLNYRNSNLIKIKIFIKKFFKFYLYKNKKFNLIEKANQLLSSGIKINFKELDIITKSILKK